MELNLEEEISMTTGTNESPETNNQSGASESAGLGMPTEASIAAALGLNLEDGDGSAGEGAAEPEKGKKPKKTGDGAGGENAGEEESTVETEEAQEETEEQSEEETTEEEESTEEEETEEEESEEEEEHSEEELPKGVKGLTKRVNKLTAKLRTTEEQLTAATTKATELEAQLEKASPTILQPTADNPLAHVNSAEDVDAFVANMKMVRRWCQQNPEGGEVMGQDNKPVTLTPEQVQQRLAVAEDAIDAAPQRKQFLEEQGKFDAYTKTVYPELFQTASPQRKLADAYIRQNPGILKFPNWRLIIGDAILGGAERERRAKEAAAAKGKTPKVSAKPKPPAVRPPSTPATTTKKAGASQATRKFLTTGNKADLVNAIAEGAF